MKKPGERMSEARSSVSSIENLYMGKDFIILNFLSSFSLKLSVF